MVSVAQIRTYIIIFIIIIINIVLSCAQAVIITSLFAKALEGIGEVQAYNAFMTKQFSPLFQLAKAKAAAGVYSWAEWQSPPI